MSGPVEALLDGANNETWPAIRKLLQRETESAITGLSKGLEGYDMDEKTKERMVTSLKDYARGVVESKTREEAGRVLIRMKDRYQLFMDASNLHLFFDSIQYSLVLISFNIANRFSTLFSHDADSMPRVWTGKEDIRAITKTARSAV